MSPAAPSTCCCRSASRMRSVLVWQGVPQTLGALRRGDNARRREADDRGRAGCLAGRDQDAGHQRRRLLQRQCRPPVREPDRAVEPRPDGVDLRARRGAHQRLRPHGRQRAPGLGDPGRHGRAVPRRRHRGLLGRGRRQPGPHRARASTGGNMEGKEVRFGIANSALFATRHDGRLLRRRQQPCTTASRRSAAWSR